MAESTNCEFATDRVVMARKRTLKPTGWVVDMRHYLDEETGDLPDAMPEGVLTLAIFFGAIVAWVTDHLPDGDAYTNVPAGAALAIVAVAARSSPSWTARPDMSNGTARSVATTG